MKNLQKWFTLVELIVVITILAILGTIAFISLQGYSADARNSKRTSDLSSIQSAMTVKVTEGMGITSFVTAVTANQVTAPSFGGTGAVVGTDYKAGTINFVALGAKNSDFQDPRADQDYVVGVTSKKGGKYQLAASMEDSTGSAKAKVVGTYGTGRNTTAVSSSNTGSTYFTLAAADIGKFFVNDTLTGGAVISKISADGLTVTFTGTPTAYGLNNAESAGLIGDNSATSSAATGTAVEDDSMTTLPY